MVKRGEEITRLSIPTLGFVNVLIMLSFEKRLSFSNYLLPSKCPFCFSQGNKAQRINSMYLIFYGASYIVIARPDQIAGQHGRLLIALEDEFVRFR